MFSINGPRTLPVDRWLFVALIFGMALVGGVLFGATGLRADDSDRHAGYYYPDNVTHETYKARASKVPSSSRQTRIAFVTGVTAQQVQAPYPPLTAMFAKGTEADKLILVSLQEGRMDTLFRARAVLAMLTATARTTPVFAELDSDLDHTFLDLLKILGFVQITVSDGRSFAHQIKIE
ncbi:MAG: molybdopterin-guanine dinucleotide biosynthesis protein A [Alphaproteobacteria bacterium]|nr:molybdopterin-guanine dinucleotide biosynthesis protein A [Alphaproteobacteria bacterium]